MAKRRKRPIRAHGALVINPRVKRARRNPAKRRNPAATKARRRNPAKRRRTLKYTPMRRPRSMGALRLNGRKRKSAPKVRRVNGRKRKTRSNPGYMKQLEKVPVVGPFLAASVGLVPATVIGGVAVYPNQAIVMGIARVAPAIPASAAYGLAGIIGGALAHIVSRKFFKVSKSTADLIGVAMAASGGAVGVHLMLTESDETVGGHVGALALRGVANPLGTVLLGEDALGDLQLMAGTGTMHGHSGEYAGPYGRFEAVYPSGELQAGRVFTPAGVATAM